MNIRNNSGLNATYQPMRPDKPVNGALMAFFIVGFLIFMAVVGPYLFFFAFNLPATLAGVVSSTLSHVTVRSESPLLLAASLALSIAITASGAFWFYRKRYRFSDYLVYLRSTQQVSKTVRRSLYAAVFHYMASVTLMGVGVASFLTTLGAGRGVSFVEEPLGLSLALVPLSVLVWAPVLVRMLDGIIENYGRRQEGRSPNYVASRFYGTRKYLRILGYIVLAGVAVLLVVTLPLLILRLSDLLGDIVSGQTMNANAFLGDSLETAAVESSSASFSYRLIYGLSVIGLSSALLVGWLKMSARARSQHIRAQWLRVLMAGTVILSANLAIAVTVVMLSGNVLMGGLLAVGVISVAFFVWRFWSRAWRGKGFSPSFRAGVRNPRPRPGQMWWVEHHGVEKVKIRPAMVVGTKGRGRNAVVTFVIMTGGEYAQRNAAKDDKYLVVENQSEVFRGFPPLWKTGDATFIDLTIVIGHRYDLRNFISNGPRSVYQDVCRAYDVQPMDSASVFDDVNLPENSKESRRYRRVMKTSRRFDRMTPQERYDHNAREYAKDEKRRARNWASVPPVGEKWSADSFPNVKLSHNDSDGSSMTVVDGVAAVTAASDRMGHWMVLTYRVNGVKVQTRMGFVSTEEWELAMEAGQTRRPVLFSAAWDSATDYQSGVLLAIKKA